MPSDERSSCEQLAARFAAGQHGLVTRRQLLGSGIRGDVIDRRIRAGGLRRMRSGIYLVGPIAPPLVHEMAALLACGSESAISHGSAGRVWGFVDPVGTDERRRRRRRSSPGGSGPAGALVHVSSRARLSGRAGIRLHITRSLRADEVTRFEGIRITTPARTLYDLARTSEGRRLERALAEALALRLASVDEIEKVLRRHHRQPGSRRLRELLRGDEPALTHSEAEELFLAMMRSARTTIPKVNAMVARYEVDFYWPAERLIVEIEGYAFHSSAQAFERDHRRDADLMAEGMHVLRFTWKQLVDEPYAVVAVVAGQLANARSAGRG